MKRKHPPERAGEMPRRKWKPKRRNAKRLADDLVKREVVRVTFFSFLKYGGDF